ncbi:hypothetical protein Tco_0407777 [Tanacetum coccineum]
MDGLFKAWTVMSNQLAQGDIQFKIVEGNSFDDENKESEEEIDLDLNNMDNTIDVSSSLTLRIHKNHPQSQIIGPTASGVKTRKQLQEEPKKITQALQDESWVEAMQEELLQFKLQNVWVLYDLPDGKRVIGTKWVFKYKIDERDRNINILVDSISWKEIGLLAVQETNNCIAISSTGRPNKCDSTQWIQQFWNTAKSLGINESLTFEAKALTVLIISNCGHFKDIRSMREILDTTLIFLKSRRSSKEIDKKKISNC